MSTMESSIVTENEKTEGHAWWRVVMLRVNDNVRQIAPAEACIRARST